MLVHSLLKSLLAASPIVLVVPHDLLHILLLSIGPHVLGLLVPGLLVLGHHLAEMAPAHRFVLDAPHVLAAAILVLDVLVTLRTRAALALLEALFPAGAGPLDAVHAPPVIGLRGARVFLIARLVLDVRGVLCPSTLYPSVFSLLLYMVYSGS